MSYAEVATVNTAEVLAAIFDFAENTLGWTVNIPTGDMTPTGKDTFRLTAATIGTGDKVRTQLTVTQGADDTKKAISEWPLTWNGAGFTYANPTRTFLFGDSIEEPWMGIVVEFGFNNYRHFYLGHTNRLGDYTNGWTIYANFYPNVADGAMTPYRNIIRYMFQAYAVPGSNTPAAKVSCGGVMVDHVDNDYPWRRFFMGINSTNNPFDSMVGDEVMGGVNDGFIGPLQGAARAPFAGANILIPYNLFAVVGDTTEDAEAYPLGEPCGIRFVDMNGLEALQEIVIGTTTWKVFPEFSKNGEAAFAEGLGLDYVTGISSGIYGVAYPKDRV